MKKLSIIFVCVFICLAISFRLFCGIFVIQPLGAIPEGTTIVYWRSGLNMPFVASADGLLDESNAGVSLLGRGLVLAGLAKPIVDRKILRLGYSDTLYLWSTGGHRYENRGTASSLHYQSPGPITYHDFISKRTPEEERYFIEHGEWLKSGQTDPGVDFPIDLP